MSATPAARISHRVARRSLRHLVEHRQATASAAARVQPPAEASLMTADRARALAERVHQGQRDRHGAPLIEHVRRVAAAVPADIQVVAWLHEVLEHTSVSEQALLEYGLSLENLRSIRLLTPVVAARSDPSYLAQVELIARALTPGADAARAVKRADLLDHTLHRSGVSPGWRPPYARGLEMLRTLAPADAITRPS